MISLPFPAYSLILDLSGAKNSSVRSHRGRGVGSSGRRASRLIRGDWPASLNQERAKEDNFLFRSSLPRGEARRARSEEAGEST